MGDPDFLHGAQARATCAAFIKESRMKILEEEKTRQEIRGKPVDRF
jgi:hypothetical protein